MIVDRRATRRYCAVHRIWRRRGACIEHRRSKQLLVANIRLSHKSLTLLLFLKGEENIRSDVGVDRFQRSERQFGRICALPGVCRNGSSFCELRVSRLLFFVVVLAVVLSHIGSDGLQLYEWRPSDDVDEQRRLSAANGSLGTIRKYRLLLVRSV